jgi:6-phosphogluconolactonase
MTTRWHVHSDNAAWLDAVLAYIDEAERQALAEHGSFHIVLAGGGTPRLVYGALARARHDWARWQVWYGDERCLPPDDPERNSRMAGEAWLDHVPVPGTNIHAMRAELGARVAARDYAEAVRGVGMFDLVLLGLGEDGHTASLFPGHDWGEADGAEDVLAVYDAPKPPAERVSLSARRLSRARRVAFLATGAGKRAAMAAWRRGDALPAAAIRPAGGVDVFLTRDVVPFGAQQ